MSKFKVGIVGLGYVGGAIKAAYEVNNKVNEIYTFDINPDRNPSCGSLDELVSNASLIYVALPTPMNKEGHCDISIVESVVNEICKTKDFKIIIVKSTVPPGTTQRLQNKYTEHNILFCPEFLTEANYINDYLHQDLMVVGISDRVAQTTVDAILEEQVSVIKSVNHCVVVDSTAAEFYKYTANVFLATKVSFANEMDSIGKQYGIEWDAIKQMLILDKRMGKTHWNVPGPDGRAGFGGTCFPKDISAMISEARRMNVPIPLLTAAWYRNVSIDRPERDWEQMKGRAVSE